MQRLLAPLDARGLGALLLAARGLQPLVLPAVTALRAPMLSSGRGLGRLVGLQSVELGRQCQGRLPAEAAAELAGLSRLSRLELGGAVAADVGPALPQSLWSLTQLRRLALAPALAHLPAGLVWALTSRLTSLQVSNMWAGGDLQLPPLSGLYALKHLDLSCCRLLGGAEQLPGHLSSLRLDHMPDAELPGAALWALTGLQTLRLEGRGAPALSPSIGALAAQLTSLHLGNCRRLALHGQALELPSSLWTLTHLRHLHLEALLPEEEPVAAGIGALVQLTSLAIVNTPPDAWDEAPRPLPAALWSLTALRRLALRHLCLEELPAGVGALAQLTSLEVSNADDEGPAAGQQQQREEGEEGDSAQAYALDRGIALLPASLWRLTQLQHLSLARNSLERLEGVGQLPQLTFLDVGVNNLVALPADLAACGRLRQLCVRHNPLPELPAAIAACTALTSLDASNCPNLASIAGAIGALSRLVRLDLHATADNSPLLPLLPDSITALARLEHLDASGLQLARLPEGIGQLAALTELRLADSALPALPLSIGGLSRLEVLVLSRNDQMSSLPATMGALAALRELHLEGSARLAALPPGLASLPRLERTHVSLALAMMLGLLPLDLSDARLADASVVLDLRRLAQARAPALAGLPPVGTALAGLPPVGTALAGMAAALQLAA
jgi:hypothetical protein